MSKFWNKNVKQTNPYVPGEQPLNNKYIKLNTNENPYPPSPQVLKVINKLTNDSLRLYPDPECRRLKVEIAKYYGINKDQVFIGNGSDEVLAFSFMTFFDSNDSILFPEITYNFYKVYCKLFNIRYKLIPLDNHFLPVKNEFFSENDGIIFANPNSPIGKYVSLSFVEEVLQRNQEQIVIIDEAYIDFGGKSAIQLINYYPNLLIIQTFSKSRSLAGLRVGFALGQKHLINGLTRIKNSFNSYTVDRIALNAAIEAIKDTNYFEKNRTKIIKTRDKVIKSLKKMCCEVVNSKANFILFKPPGIQADDLYQKLKEKRILVRHFDQQKVNNYLRVSVGTEKQMMYFIEVLNEII